MLMQVKAPEEVGPLGDFFRQLGKSIISFPGQVLRGIAETARTTPNPFVGASPFTFVGRPEAEQVALNIPEQTPAEETLVGRLGTGIVEGAEELIPGGPEGFAGQVGAGIGSTAGFVGSAVLGPGGPFLAGQALTADDLTQQAKAAGADDQTVQQAARLGALIGSSESIPLGRLFSKLNRFSGIGLRKVVVEALKQGGEEAAQEVFQQVSINAAALGLFDENRELLDGVLESGGVGLVVGMLFGGVGGAAVGNVTGEQVRELMLGPEGVTAAGIDFGQLSKEEFSEIEKSVVPGEGNVLEGFLDEANLADLAQRFSETENVEEREVIAEQINESETFQRLQERFEELISTPNLSDNETTELEQIVETMRGQPLQQLDAQFSVATPARPASRPIRETILEAVAPEDLTGVVGLSNALRGVLEERFGITSRRIGKDVRPISQAIQQAQVIVAQDSAGRTAAQIAVARANDINRNLTGVVTSNRSMLLSDVEHGLMLLGGAELVTQREALSLHLDAAIQAGDENATRLRRNDITQIDNQLEEIFTATDLAGSEAGRALNARRAYLRLIDLTPEGIIREARLMKGTRLNQEETAKLLEQGKESRVARDRLEQLMGTRDERFAEGEKTNAEESFRNTLKEKVTREQLDLLLEEREQIKVDLRALGFTGLQEGLTSTGRFAAEALWNLGKLVKNMIKEGNLRNIEEVVAAVQQTPGLEVLRPIEIYQALNAQRPKVKNAAKKAERTRLQHIKKQAKQLERVEKLARAIASRHGIKLEDPIPGIIPVVTSGGIRARDVKTGEFVSSDELRGFNSATAQLKQLLLSDSTLITEEVQTMIRGLEIVQNQIKVGEFERAGGALRQVGRILSFDRRTAETNQKLESEDFRPPDKIVEEATPFDRELLRAKIRYRRERHKLQNEIARLKPFFQEGDTTVRKGVRLAQEATRLSRQLLTIDIASAFLRQGVIGIGMPKEFGKNAIVALRTFLNVGGIKGKQTAESMALILDEHPRRFDIDEMGVDITEVGGGVQRGEELFGSYVIRQLPGMAEALADLQNDPSLVGALKVAGAGVKELSEAAERVYTIFLNLMRFSFAEQFLDAYPDATLAQRRSYGRMVNAMTGRGNMKASTAAAASTVLFAPKFAYSRFETIGRTIGASKDVMVAAVSSKKLNPASAQIAKDMGKFIGMTLSTLGLFAAAGAAGLWDDEDLVVGTDPESSDFGKIIVGNTRYDIFGGLQQPVSLALRFAVGALDRAGLREAIKVQDPYDLGLRYALYKTSPAITLPATLLFGETVVGQEVGPGDAVLQSFMPLFTQDFSDALKTESFARSVAAGTAASFGIGASTFGNEMRAGDMVKLLSRARIGMPPRPKYRDSVKEDKTLKESLDAAYETMLAERLRARSGRLKLLEGERLERVIRLQATVVRRKFRRFSEAASVSGRKPSEARVDAFLEKVGQ